MSQGGWGGGYGGGGGGWAPPPGGGGYGPPPGAPPFGPPPGAPPFGPPPGAPPGYSYGPGGFGPGDGGQGGQGAGRFLKTALIGGLIGGAIGSVPLLGGLLNCCLCLPNMAGAAIGISMYLKESPRENISAGDAAISGVMSGLVAGVMVAVIGLIMNLAVGSMMAGLYRSMPREMRALMLRSAAGGFAGFLVNPPIYAAFGALGGFLSMQLFFKDRLKP